MTGTFKIKPTVKDSIVRDPDTLAPLEAKGEVKPKSPYWLRRIAKQEVEVVLSKPQTKSKPKTQDQGVDE